LFWKCHPSSIVFCLICMWKWKILIWKFDIWVSVVLSHWRYGEIDQTGGIKVHSRYLISKWSVGQYVFRHWKNNWLFYIESLETQEHEESHIAKYYCRILYNSSWVRNQDIYISFETIILDKFEYFHDV
jgi:hypothetical protein